MNKETVEQAALDYATAITLEPQDSQEYFSFMLGAEWQKEQSVNEAIEFADWCTQKEYVKNGSPREWNLGGVFSKRYSDKELYQKWQESKNK
jgi:hypothetical protein